MGIHTCLLGDTGCLCFGCGGLCTGGRCRGEGGLWVGGNLEVYEWEEGTGKVDVWVSMAFARVGRSVLDMLAAANTGG